MYQCSISTQSMTTYEVAGFLLFGLEYVKQLHDFKVKIKQILFKDISLPWYPFPLVLLVLYG